MFNYHIHGSIDELNIWRFTLKMQLARFLIGGLEYYMERNPCLQPKWHTFLIWQYLCNSPNHQIKATTKYTTNTVIAIRLAG